jgi:hypothetical protein
MSFICHWQLLLPRRPLTTVEVLELMTQWMLLSVLSVSIGFSHRASPGLILPVEAAALLTWWLVASHLWAFFGAIVLWDDITLLLDEATKLASVFVIKYCWQCPVSCCSNTLGLCLLGNGLTYPCPEWKWWLISLDVCFSAKGGG